MSKTHTKESTIQGRGVFATISIAEGEIILAIDDTHIVDEEHPLRNNIDETWCDYLKDNKVVIMQEPERYINHSCEPNSFVKTINNIRYVVALKDISIDEEITYDYCINGNGETVWNCSCGKTNCRKIIHSDFFHLPIELQIKYLPLLDTWYVEQYGKKIQTLINLVLTDQI